MEVGNLFSLFSGLFSKFDNCYEHYVNCYGRSTSYSDRLHDFSVTIPKFYENVNDATPRFKTSRWLHGWVSLKILFFFHNVNKKMPTFPKVISMFYLIIWVWTLSLTKLSLVWCSIREKPGKWFALGNCEKHLLFAQLYFSLILLLQINYLVYP